MSDLKRLIKPIATALEPNDVELELFVRNKGISNSHEVNLRTLESFFIDEFSNGFGLPQKNSLNEYSVDRNRVVEVINELVPKINSPIRLRTVENLATKLIHAYTRLENINVDCDEDEEEKIQLILKLDCLANDVRMRWYDCSEQEWTAKPEPVNPIEQPVTTQDYINPFARSSMLNRSPIPSQSTNYVTAQIHNEEDNYSSVNNPLIQTSQTNQSMRQNISNQSIQTNPSNRSIISERSDQSNQTLNTQIPNQHTVAQVPPTENIQATQVSTAPTNRSPTVATVGRGRGRGLTIGNRMSGRISSQLSNPPPFDTDRSTPVHEIIESMNKTEIVNPPDNLPVYGPSSAIPKVSYPHANRYMDYVLTTHVGMNPYASNTFATQMSNWPGPIQPNIQTQASILDRI